MSSEDRSTLEIEDCGLGGVLLLKPPIYRDDRGSFREILRTGQFESATGIVRPWAQSGHSMSTRNVLRGIHYQLEPPQGKIVTCVVGAIFDVVVDLRRSSSMFGKWVGAMLTEENGYQTWIPEGFGHGFLTVSDTADVIYQFTSEYAPAGYRSVRWDDPDLGIDWPLSEEPALSDRDRIAPLLRDAEVFD